MDNKIIKDNEYRIKKMNAIEILALKSQIDFSTVESTIKCYSTILERIEVKVKDQWIPVKDKDNYYPAELENDSNFITQETIDALQSSIDSLVDEVNENEYVAAQALTKLENEKANKSDVPTSLSQLTNDSGFITASEIPSQDLSGYATVESLSSKQDTLVSGTNIKTINGESLLGSGDITITSGVSDEDFQEMNTKVVEMQALILTLQEEITKLKSELNKTLVIE